MSRDTGRTISNPADIQEMGFADSEQTPQPGDFVADAIIESPAEESVPLTDAETGRYISEHQRELKRRIEGQKLPVCERISEVVDALTISHRSGSGIVLLQGETGSGKSIYSPVAVREALKQLGLPEKIVMMQPRRDAASGVARGVAAVTNEELGRGVGYSTSETKKVHLDTDIAVVTSGIFLRHLVEGRFSKGDIGAVILDEIHEGSLEYHLVFGLLKKLRREGKAPLVLLTSATMNKDRLQEFFGIKDEEYLRIEGRAHPVDQFYAEPKHSDEADEARHWYKNSYIDDVAKKAKELGESNKEGDILIFAPGAYEIEQIITQIGEIPGCEVLPLHGSLHEKDRDYALLENKKSGIKRRIIVATNIAETSVTVPGITMVIDSCRQRAVRYNSSNGIVEKGTELISQDQADQRAGRAGRVQPGECYRMVTREEYAKMKRHPESEIKRSNLSHVVLRLKKMGIDPEHFDFFEQPEERAIHNAVKELHYLGAIDDKNKLTELGLEMAETQLEPRIARMIIEAKRRDCAEAAIILAVSSREDKVLLGPDKHDKRPFEVKRREVQEIHASFEGPFHSDWVRMINIFLAAVDRGLFDVLQADERMPKKERERIQQEFRAFCESNYLNNKALRHIAKRIFDFAKLTGVAIDRRTLIERIHAANIDDLSCSILSGYSDQIYYKDSYQKFSYFPLSSDTAHRAAFLHPGSAGFSQSSTQKLFIAGKVEESAKDTSKVYANMLHPITATHIAEVCPNVVDFSEGYIEMSLKNCQPRVVAIRTAQKHGENLGAAEFRPKGDDAVDCFAHFLAHWIYPVYDEGKDWKQQTVIEQPRFVIHNQEIFQQYEVLRQKARHLLQVIDPASEYKKIIGQATALKDLDEEDPTLYLSLEDLCPVDVQKKIRDAFPDHVEIKGKQFPVEYTFEEHGFTTTIEFSSRDIVHITDQDLPQLGFSEQQHGYLLQLSELGIKAHTIEELKDNIDAFEIKSSVFERWVKDQPAQDPYTLVLFSSLPDFAPVVYAHTRHGVPVFAYPALSLGTEWRGVPVEIIRVKYYPNQKLADQAKKYVIKKKNDLEQQEMARRTAEETRKRAEDVARAKIEEGGSHKEEARELYYNVLARIHSIQDNSDQYGFSLQDSEIFYNIVRAVELFGANNPQTQARWRRQFGTRATDLNTDYRDIIAELRSIDTVIDKKIAEHAQRKERVKQVLHLFDFMQDDFFHYLTPMLDRYGIKTYGREIKEIYTIEEIEAMVNRLNSCKQYMKAGLEDNLGTVYDMLRRLYFSLQRVVHGRDQNRFKLLDAVNQFQSTQLVHVENGMVTSVSDGFSGKEIVKNPKELVLGGVTFTVKGSVLAGNGSKFSLDQQGDYFVAHDGTILKVTVGPCNTFHYVSGVSGELDIPKDLFDRLPKDRPTNTSTDLHYQYYSDNKPLRPEHKEAVTRTTKEADEQVTADKKDQYRPPQITGDMDSAKRQELWKQQKLLEAVLNVIASIPQKGAHLDDKRKWAERAKKRKEQLILDGLAITNGAKADTAQGRINSGFLGVRSIAKEMAYKLNLRDDWIDELLKIRFVYTPEIEANYGGTFPEEKWTAVFYKELAEIVQNKTIEHVKEAVEPLIAEMLV